MNLWVKRTGQLLLAALFLMSCEDESYLLGFRNQNKKFNVGYQEFQLGEGIVRADSIITDNLGGTQRLLVGQYQDINSDIGSVRTETFVQFLPAKTDSLEKSNLIYKYDSIVLQFRLDYYSYGLVDQGVSEFNIHRITPGDTLTWYKRYYSNSKPPEYDINSLQVGDVKLVKLTRVGGVDKLKAATLKRSTLENAADTLLMRCRLNDSFGQELFDIALNDADKNFSDSKKFKTLFSGFALIPKTVAPSMSDAVIGLTPDYTSLTKMTLYYHTEEVVDVVKDKLTRDFTATSGPSFHTIKPSRSGGLPSDEAPFNGVVPFDENLRAVQAGSPMLTKIDLSPFYSEFADTIDTQIVINSAELIIQSVSSSTGYNPVSFLELRVMREDNNFMNYTVDEDSAQMKGYFVIVNSRFYHYLAQGDDLYSSTSVPALLSYSSSNSKYSGFMTFFFQNLFNDVLKDRERTTPKPPEERLRYLGLYPNGEAGKILSRSLLDKRNIKLRIYYTYPNKPNL